MLPLVMPDTTHAHHLEDCWRAEYYPSGQENNSNMRLPQACASMATHLKYKDLLPRTFRTIPIPYQCVDIHCPTDQEQRSLHRDGPHMLDDKGREETWLHSRGCLKLPKAGKRVKCNGYILGYDKTK